VTIISIVSKTDLADDSVAVNMPFLIHVECRVFLVRVVSFFILDAEYEK
jgi:ethanolamine utilization protein EutP (predicted NTPase)